MFKGHPKGLFVAFFANMGERFGFYTMMAILVLFLQVKFGLSEDQAGGYYSWFYFGIYALALFGGFLADLTKKYKLVIFAGMIIMLAGYIIMAMPGMTLTITLAGLFTIAFGNGLFKGNLQAVVGQLYDDPKYSKMRDSAFMVFYMGINIGAFFAPFAATGVRNWWLRTNGFLHDGSLPAICHQLLNGKLTNTDQMQQLANSVSLNGQITDLSVFAQKYIEIFSRGYNYAFAIAAGAMIVSMLVYAFFQKHLPKKEKVSDKTNMGKESASSDKLSTKPWIGAAAIGVGALAAFLISLIKDIPTGLAIGLFGSFVTWIILISTKEEKGRVTALILVFFVVIFFWMSFHQNGLTLTFFARDYTAKTVDSITFLFFTLPSILSVIAIVAGIFLILGKNKLLVRITGAAMIVAGVALCINFIITTPGQNAIAPEVFQSFNPLFIVALTPLIMGLFALLNKMGKEPSTPKKIGIGMVIAALGFFVVLVGSIGLIAPHTLNGAPVPDSSRVTPYWLVSSYLVLTIAELFLSPMGLSFVSKVSPARFQGLMQGGWLLATSVGNKLLFVGSTFWGKLELWQLWSIFIICCLLSATFIFTILKRLERATK